MYKYSYLRDWLNNEFYNNAFALDDNNINLSFVDNYLYGENGSEDINDKIYILNWAEYTSEEYGFSSSYYESGMTGTKTF